MLMVSLLEHQTKRKRLSSLFQQQQQQQQQLQLELL
jgi:hypothetical protein